MLEVITGCMYAGKTNRFISRIKELQADGKNVCVLKPIEDSRYAKNDIVSHDGIHVRGLAIDETEEIWEFTDDCDVLAIDEAQFFSWDFAEIVNEIADKGIHVLISGLDLDFKGTPFSIMPELLALSDDVTKLHAVCSVCRNRATRSQRLVNGFPAKKSASVVVESVDDFIRYEPRCRAHHEFR